jgi:hypothetical protein
VIITGRSARHGSVAAEEDDAAVDVGRSGRSDRADSRHGLERPVPDCRTLKHGLDLDTSAQEGWPLDQSPFDVTPGDPSREDFA